MLRPLTIALLFSGINVALFAGLVPGVVSVDDLALPGGLATHTLQAIVIGTAAWTSSVQEERAQRSSLPTLGVSLSLTATAVAMLIIVGGSVLPVLFSG
ncbi:hypothetical protein SIL72_02430 [Rubrobacter radiotolerans]|uniref:Uncharacterized protein n=1 Tax=Rubrobacter radiotolerans TaxID=42256 RepID=A0AB35T2J7_RUBRA|nr:hypothetical protein [Rubrobacter radiotolerans]MDX5892877.1 hypothetical protein [Rubrobacter radiotolerans]